MRSLKEHGNLPREQGHLQNVSRSPVGFPMDEELSGRQLAMQMLLEGMNMTVST